jgi:hemolysin activation/secretion protein
VKGSRYFDLDTIRKGIPALAPGSVPNFDDLSRQLTGLNQWPDRRVTITKENIRPGAEPNTVDVDLTVKDTYPLHGSVELNNRYSPDTSELRINGGVSYSNLWQLGHSAGVSFQISPENTNDVKVISGFYLARLPNVDWLTLTLQATKQDSNVSTLGGAAVAGKGETVGLRFNFTLPQLTNYVHSLSLGIDYKHYEQNVLLGLDETAAPTSYYPISLVYSGTWLGRTDKAKLGYVTELNAGLYFNLRGMGSSETSFDNSRFGASGNFIYFRGDLSHEHDLPGGFQAMAKIQGQLSSGPLVSAEQFSAGGLSSVRGYLEGEVPGDNAIIGSLELRTPSLLNWLGASTGEWRFYTFVDAGYLTINDPLPEQDSHWSMASIGAGSRLRLFDHLNGSIDAGMPLISQSHSNSGDWLFTFRVWADF